MDLISVLRNLQQINNNMNQVALIANAKGFVDTAAYWENVELLKETIHELLEVMYGSEMHEFTLILCMPIPSVAINSSVRFRGLIRAMFTSLKSVLECIIRCCRMS